MFVIKMPNDEYYQDIGYDAGGNPIMNTTSNIVLAKRYTEHAAKSMKTKVGGVEVLPYKYQMTQEDEDWVDSVIYNYGNS